GFIFAQGTLEGLEQKDRQIDSLRADVASAETELLVLAKKQAKLRHWQAISLPADRNLASRRYDTFIRDLCQRHFPNREGEQKKWQISSAAPTPGGRNTGVASPISLSLTLTGVTLHQLLEFFEEFHAADVPHLIRHIAITPQGSGPDARLDVTALKIEALALPAAVDRDSLPVVIDLHRMAAELVLALQPTLPLSLRGVARLSPRAVHGSHKLASAYEPTRDYGLLATKNVFLGLKPPSALGAGDRDVLKGVQLTAIQANFINTEAWVRNRFTNEF